MHFIVDVSVWLHQGAHVCSRLPQGYGLYWRTSENRTPDSPQEEAADSGNSDVHAVDQKQQQQRPYTRSQWQAADAIYGKRAGRYGTQSITATIDYRSLATAMSRMNARSD